MENGRATEANRSQLVAAGRPRRVDGAVDPFQAIGDEISMVLRRTHDAVIALRAQARAEVDHGRVEADQLILDVRTQAERYAAQLSREAEVYARTVRAEADRYVAEVRREAEVLSKQQATLHQQLLELRSGRAPLPVAAVPPSPQPAPETARAAPGPVAAPNRPSQPASNPASAENGEAPFFAALLDESHPEPGPRH